MKVTWDNSSETESKNEDQGEISYMCCIAIDDELKSLDLNDKSSDDEFDDLSYEELLNDFHDLHKSCEKLILKNYDLKKKISNLSKELNDF